MQIRLFWTWVFFSLMTHGLSAQNMVINPSFEEIWNCPYTMNQLKLVKSWFPFGTADPSPDYFHRCADENNAMGIPKNIFGTQEPRTGDSYIGMICYLTSKSGKSWRVPANHREFVMIQLTKPLVAGNKYYGEFYVSLADNCEFSIDQLGMYFTKDMPSFDWQAMDLGYYKPQIVNPKGKVINDPEKWHKVSGEFVAQGDELALTVGVFTPDKELTTKKTKRKFGFGRDPKLPKHLQPMISYYLIDDVLVRPVDENESIFPEIDSTLVYRNEYFGIPEVGKKFTLQQIYFEFDKARLLRGSFVELNKLLEFMKEHPRVKISIEGHTDNIGSRSYNQELSLSRANAVRNFLTAKGIDNFRVETKGYGSSQPIVPNTTPENRALNRRVEVEILEN
ncbi:OmpA family protein [Reichenbachiella versicolor]|uniref:OmpA family protein n=1 Tax=Reichenbachiella versicolor TaxID=1821036 RepID=UPI000D6E56CF|nr:OmpA family protein [Reichenbachiella versicolor]